MRLAAFASLKSEPITVPLARDVLGDVIPPHGYRPPIEQIQEEVAAYYGLTVAKLTSGSREQKVALPRQVAMYLCRELAKEKLQSIAEKFNKKDHTTVIVRGGPREDAPGAGRGHARRGRRRSPRSSRPERGARRPRHAARPLGGQRRHARSRPLTCAQRRLRTRPSPRARLGPDRARLRARPASSCGSSVDPRPIPLGTACGSLLTVFPAPRYTTGTQLGSPELSGRKAVFPRTKAAFPQSSRPCYCF